MADAIDTIAAAVATDASQSAVTFVGDLEHGRRAGGPRIVWVPRGGSVESADQDEDDTSKSCNTLVERCDVHFLHSSRENARTLFTDFLAALFRTQTRWSAKPGDYDHSTETLTGKNRHEIRLTVTVDIPVTFEEYTAAEVDAVAQTTTVTN